MPIKQIPSNVRYFLKIHLLTKAFACEIKFDELMIMLIDF